MKTVGEVRGDLFSKTRCQRIIVGKEAIISVSSFLICDHQSQNLFRGRSVCPYAHAAFALSLPFNWRDLALSPVEKPPTHGAPGSQLSETPKQLAALNRSPTQHHYTDHSYINTGFQQQPPHTNCTVPPQHMCEPKQEKMQCMCNS